MHSYLMKIFRWFSGYEEFVIEAESKDDALLKAKKYVHETPPFCWGGYNYDDIKCVKKLRPKGRLQYDYGFTQTTNF